MSHLIMVCEDDKDILNLISYNLEREGFQTHGVTRGDRVLGFALELKPSVILLDVMLPEKGGLEICREARTYQSLKAIPIILVSARTTEADRVLGLEAGADDYVSKPFSMKELLARVKAAIRRNDRGGWPDNLKIDKDAFKVYIDEVPIALTLTEFTIFLSVAERRGKAISRYELGEILDSRSPVSGRSIDVHVFSLRKKLNQMADIIETVRGIGYRFRSGLEKPS